MVGQMPEAAATINSATMILTRTPLMPEPKPTTTHDENKQEREKKSVLDLSITKRGEEERRRREARGKCFSQKRLLANYLQQLEF